MAILLEILAGGAVDASGGALAGGKAYIYQVGTTTKVDIFSDNDLTQALSNPVTLDAAGRAEIYTNQSVRVVLEDSSGAQIDDIDNVGDVASLAGDVTLGSSSSNILTINSRIDSDLIPRTASVYAIGDQNQPWKAIYLDNGSTDGGAVLFNAGTTAFLKANAAGTILDIGGFTSLTLAAATSITGNSLKNQCHGWCFFDGTGTAAITDSFNVDSLDDDGTGSYGVNWDTDFADGNYCCVANGTGSYVEVDSDTAAGAAELSSKDDAGALQDDSGIRVMAVGART